MPVVEGPVAVQRGGRTSVLYAASHSRTDDYCLALLDLVGADPLDPAAWRKQERPVLATSPGVCGPGHASVVPDGDDGGWLVYHTHREPGSGWDRQVRTAPYTWGPDGEMVVTPDEVVVSEQRTPPAAAVRAAPDRARLAHDERVGGGGAARRPGAAPDPLEQPVDGDLGEHGLVGGDGAERRP
jgi:hypothetical protein